MDQSSWSNCLYIFRPVNCKNTRQRNPLMISLSGLCQFFAQARCRASLRVRRNEQPINVKANTSNQNTNPTPCPLMPAYLESIFLLLPLCIFLLPLLPLPTLLGNHITKILLELGALSLASLLLLSNFISSLNCFGGQPILLQLTRVEGNINVARLLPL